MMMATSPTVLCLLSITVFIGAHVKAQNCSSYALDRNIFLNVTITGPARTDKLEIIFPDNITQVLVGRLTNLTPNVTARMPDGQLINSFSEQNCYAYFPSDGPCPAFPGQITRLPGLVPPNTLQFFVSIHETTPTGQVFNFDYTFINCTTAASASTQTASSVTTQVANTTAITHPSVASDLRAEVIVGICIGAILGLVAFFVMMCLIARNNRNVAVTKRESLRPISSNVNSKAPAASDVEEQVPPRSAADNADAKPSAPEEQPMYINVKTQGEGSGSQGRSSDSVYVNEASEEVLYEAPIPNQTPVDPTYMNI